MSESIVLPSLASVSPAASTSRPLAASNGAGESTVAAANGDSAATEGTSPFALVLQRQLAQAKAKDVAKDVGKPVAAVTAAKTTKTAEDDAPSGDGLAALMPLILSLGTMANADASIKLAEKKLDTATEDALQLAAGQMTNLVTDPAAATLLMNPVATPTPTAAAPAIDPAAALAGTAPAPVIGPTAALAASAPAPAIDPAAALAASVPAPAMDPAAALAASVPAPVIDPAATQAATATAPATDANVALATAAAPAVIPGAKTDANAIQEPTAQGLAAFLAQSMGATGKPDTGLKMPERKASTSAEVTLPLARVPAEPINVRPEADSTAKKLPEAAISAALSAPSGETQAVAANNSETTARVTFENQLATAQAAIQTHGSEAPAVAPIKVETPVGTRGWDGEVGEKVVWMVGHQQQRAELVLNPPSLGRVEVTLSMTGDQANASFVSANPAVRDALEAALPRLRETLADAGINLGQANVGSQSSNQSNQYANKQENWDNPARSSGNFAQADSTLLQIGAASPWLKQGNSLVDVFA